MQSYHCSATIGIGPAGSFGRLSRPFPATLPGAERVRAPVRTYRTAAKGAPMSEVASDPARYFGREVRRTRLAARMSLADLGRVIGYHASQVSRVERGTRAVTEKFAQGCDRAFPGRGGWFIGFYRESRRWSATSPMFRNWIEEHEQRAVSLRIWQPSSLSGLLQTEAFALALLRTFLGATSEQIEQRLSARMSRKVVLTRDKPAPPMVWFLVDEAALRRCTGSALVMAEQLDHLLALAALPNVTIQVVPNVGHAGLTGGFAIAEKAKGSAAYIETALGGQVFEDAQAVQTLSTRFDALRTEALRGTESLRLIEELAREWRRQATGASPATQAQTAASA
jgi:transcriptional regulator with XRE-family HTH domain